LRGLLLKPIDYHDFPPVEEKVQQSVRVSSHFSPELPDLSFEVSDERLASLYVSNS